jgi:beta-glucosidase
MTDIQGLVAQMTLEEKAALCTGANAWQTTPIKRLGVPALTVSDGPHGLRRVAEIESLVSESLPATCFPTASGLAASWDVALLREMGQALAEEASALGVGVILGPGVNMKRTPLCGRNFEYFSEDPYLAGAIAASLIEGIQSKGVGTSLKHYAANNQEFERLSIDAQVDERTLREIYLPAFEMAVTKAQPWTVMCSYNRLNGAFASEHHWLLTEVLKEEWGFEGFVVSDWGAVHNRVAALKAGLDLEMPGPKQTRVNAVIEAVRNGELDEAILDESVRRILTIVCRASQMPKGGEFDVAGHHALARRISAECMVLLKNNGILPLRDPQHIAVIGNAAMVCHFQGGGSSHINPTQVDNPFDELRELAGNAELSYARGYPADDSRDQALIDEAVATARTADVALLYIALPTFKESEGYDRTDLDLTAQQVALIKAVTAAQPNTVVILNNGAPVVMGEWLEGTAAVLESWMMGQAGGGAIADVLFGRVNPSGKLAETYPRRLVDTPAYINFPGENGVVRYGEGLFIGYRYYDAKDVPVQFPFGYGLSYTTFAYDNLQVSADDFDDVDGLTVTVEVSNTGPVAGKEIVQVYVHDRESRLARPYKELKGFAKVELQPGETKTVAIPLDFRAFAYYDPAHQQWVTEDGQFDILVGASSADIRGRATVTLRSTLQLRSVLTDESTVRAWVNDPEGRMILQPILEELMKNSNFLSAENSSSISMDMMTFMLETPLRSFFHFLEGSLTQPPDDITDMLVEQLHGVKVA